MRNLFAGSPEFRRLLDGDSSVSLSRIALEIASDAYPNLDIERHLSRLASLTERVRVRCPSDAKPRVILGHVNWVLFIEEGFRGNDAEYDDPRNSYLNDVLDRKTGIPISLSVLYAAVAEPLGVSLVGVNLPAHYVLRLETADPPLFVDAYHSGAFLDREACERQVSTVVGRPIRLSDAQFAPCSASTIVERMLRNLKAIYVRSDDYVSALPVARRLAALDPNNVDDQRDWGLLAYKSGRPGEAVEPLARYREARADAEDAEVVHQLLRAARRDVAQSN